MSMRHMATQNSNQWTTQGGWRYTPCGKWITSRTYIGYVPDIKWHREHSKNAKFSDGDAARVQPLCKACIYRKDR